MAMLNTISQSNKATLPALSGFALLFLCVNPLDEAAAQFSHLLCALTGELFKFVPSIILAVFQAFETYALDHAQLFQCLQTLVSSWPLLHFVSRAV
jgi:hypothetical protein